MLREKSELNRGMSERVSENVMRSECEQECDERNECE